MPFLRLLRRALLLVLAAGAGLLLYGWLRPPAAGDDLAALPGLLAAPAPSSPAACHALLDRAGIRYRPLPPVAHGTACGFADGIAWTTGGAREARYAPAAPPLACPLAVALARWEWDVVQPAAARRLGTTVREVDHYGSYACRRLYGRAAGDWSLHARADALDVAGFRLADGRRITVATGWRGDGPEAAFLHDVRDGACRLFGTTLSPDYNAAHRDHLHLDGAARGGWRACR